jgi:NAD(P)-dependent dehydrogenase (short-subunit alcohol dehydrogenase family)
MSKSILITGATRGLGRHLAGQFAARGYRLALTGRDPQALEALAADLRKQTGPGEDAPGHIVTARLDVRDYTAIGDVLAQCAGSLSGLDIVVANAGVALPSPAGKGGFDQARAVIDINLLGAMATADAAIGLFREQGHGHLVGISSVAGVRGMRNQGAYCASKAALSRYLEAVRLETARENIAVTDLAPGFIDTDLNRGMPSRPFVISADKGTRIMADLIERQVKFRYVPGWPWALLAPVLGWLPDSVIGRM